MENLPVVQNFESPRFGDLTTIFIDNEIWFIGKEVAKKLGYANTRDALARFCKRQTILKPNDFGSRLSRLLNINNRGITIIPESDVYRLAWSSKLDDAEKFRIWISEKILPSIRKTGSYSIHNEKELFSVKNEITHSKSWDSLPTKGINLDILDSSYSTMMKEIKLVNEILSGSNLSLYSILKVKDGIAKKYLGASILEDSLDEETKELICNSYFTPTDIGKRLDPKLSPQQVNKLLIKYNFQKRIDDKLIPIGRGCKYASILDRKILLDDGSMKSVKQLKWEPKMLNILQNILDED